MFFRSAKPRLSAAEAMSARPVRSAEAVLERTDAGGRIRVPFRPANWAKWLLRSPPDAIKTFELDAVGVFVWELCDGKSTVGQIIRKLADRYTLNERAAEVATVTFLRTLVRKGLVGMAMPGNPRDGKRLKRA